jgi:hypothetical protein
MNNQIVPSLPQERTAIVFLCDTIKPETHLFAAEIKQRTNFNVILVQDSASTAFMLKQANSQTIEFSNGHNPMLRSFTQMGVHIFTALDDVCISDGFYGCNIDGKQTSIKKEVIAWDKFLYSYAWFKLNILKEIGFFWVFEEDVFIPSIDALEKLSEKYSGYGYVCRNHIERPDGYMGWHWPHVEQNIDGPYYSSMVPAVGLSRSLLNAVLWHRVNKGCFFHIEAMFSTIAEKKRRLDVNYICGAKEFGPCVALGEWTYDHFWQRPDYFWHPVKNIEKHEDERAHIIEAVEEGLAVIRELPDFVK